MRSAVGRRLQVIKQDADEFPGLIHHDGCGGVFRDGVFAHAMTQTGSQADEFDCKEEMSDTMHQALADIVMTVKVLHRLSISY